MKNNDSGFTLIEMLIVLLIISVLIIITIPNVTKHFATIDEKGCDAFVAMVQGQVEAYKIDFNKYPSVEELVEEGYLKESETNCPNGDQVQIDDNGQVTAISSEGDHDE
ncbi:competence protein ComGC [Lysinibacillus sp. PLM2]|nr:competence protein ComGC [Lysinibacillus sp. PLM2]